MSGYCFNNCTDILNKNTFLWSDIMCKTRKFVRLRLYANEKGCVRFLTLRHWVKIVDQCFSAGYPQTLNATTFNVTITDTWQLAGLTEN